MAVTAAQLQQLYLAYFGRPADFDGIVFYTTGDWDIWQVARAFGESPESQSLYGPGFNASVVNAIYQNLFNRDAEADGLLYWSQQVASGALTPGEAALGILLGAQNADATTVANKLAVAAAFTAELDTATEILAYTGDAAAAAARAFLHTVTSDPASVTAAEANIDATIATIIDVGGITGDTIALTVDPDSFTSANSTFIDTVNGIIDEAGTKSTFSDSDTITGNGHTVVNVTVKDISTVAPVVQMSDIAKLTLIAAGETAATFDAGQWTNVSQIVLSGTDGMYAQIDDLTNAGPLKLKIDGATTGTIEITSGAAADVGGVSLYGTLQNTTGDAVGAVAAFGTTGIDVTLGASDTASFDYYQSKTGTGTTAVKVGSISVAHVNINAGTLANADTISVYNYAQAVSAAATVGSISLGNLAVNAATSADAYLYLYNEATVTTKGAATAGDLTTFWINMNAGSGASATVSMYNWAYSNKGAATVGNLNLGGLSMSGTGYAYLEVENSATAATSGAAKAGNLTIGDINIHSTSGTNNHSAYLYNYAFADKGAATVGNVSAGNVDMLAGDGSYQELSISNYATNNLTGAVTAGTMTVGNVSLETTGEGTNYVYLYNSADAFGGKGGAATVGAMTIGNVSMSVASSSNYMYVYEDAGNAGSAGGAATLGSLTMGSVTMNQVAATGGSTNYLYISRSAHSAKGSATAGNVSIGDVTINAAGITQASGDNEVYVYNYAYAHGTTGVSSVGSLTIGNVTAKTGISGYIYVSLTNSGTGATSGDTGMVTVGNISMTGSKSASMYFEADNYMNGVGGVGGITVGNVSIKGDTSVGVAYLSLENIADSGDSHNVSVGNVTLQANSNWLHIYNEATAGGSAGTTTVGNVSLKGGSYPGTNWIWASGEDGAGAMTVGTVSLTTVKAENVNLHIGQSAHAGGTSGLVTVGDVTLTLADSDTNAGAGASLNFEVYNDGGKASGGNIVTGNITVGTSGVTTKALMTAAMDASVSISSVDGNVTVGNITVGAGGAKGTTLAANTDNLADLSAWFTASAGGTVTIGNVDYSAYSAAATIDVSGYAGAGTIKSGKGGAVEIVDNKGTNTIDLSANTTKGDFVYQLIGQSAIKDTGTAGTGGGVVTADQSAIDTITGWAAGDGLSLWDGTGGVAFTVGGDGDVIQNTPSQTYAQFLANAEIQITQANNSAYVAVIGGDTYVALNYDSDADNDGVVGTIVKISGAHTFAWSTDIDGTGPNAVAGLVFLS